MMKHCNKYIAVFFILIGLLLLNTAVSFAQDNTAQQREVQELQQKEDTAKETIKEKEESAKTIEEEAAAIARQKEALKKEAEIKEKAAAVVKEEAKILEKEAEVKEDSAIAKEAAERAAEAEKLEKEAALQKEKVKIVESKEDIARKKLEGQQAEIEALKKSLQEIKIEKAGKRGFLENTLRSIPIIVVGLFLFLLLRLSLKWSEKLLSRKEAIREDAIVLRMKTISKLVNWLGGIVLTLAVVYLVLETFGYSVAPLLAGAGIVGLAFGFGGQYLIRDIINGLFIIIEDQYRINDVVKIGDYGGLVEDINLRITTLRDLEGRVIIVPNGEIKTVVNYTKGYAQALLDIGVAYKENVDKVIQIIKDIGKEMRQDKYFGKLILADLEMFGLDDFADSAVVIKFRIKTLPIKQWEVMREFRRRLKNRFDELGIEIPFPHRTLYWGTGKDNEWMKTPGRQKI